MNQEQLQKQVRNAGVIDSFCYPYAKLLFNKLILLKMRGDFFRKESDDEDVNIAQRLTTIAYSVVSALMTQIEFTSNYNSSDLSMKEVNELIKTVQEFLAIFEDK